MTLKKELSDYSKNVVNGKIVSCKKHKQACQRFLNDLKKQKTEHFPYIFDEKRANKFLAWMRLFKHTKGILAGQYIEPDITQKFIYGNIYGWIHRKTKLRRFKKAYWQVGRKNAKSQGLSCVGSFEGMAYGVPFSEVYVGATKKDQAKIVWNEIKAQLQDCDFLRGKFKVAYGQIQHPKSGSKIEALSKDSTKTGDGFNPQTGIIDEYHAHPTSEIYDILASGMGARKEPLMFIITTAGFEINNPCYKVEYKYVSNILNPNVEIWNDEYFVMINELESIEEVEKEENWVKANPILCSYEEGMSFLRSEYKVAFDAPEKKRNFLTKNMNIWLNQRENGYMDLEKWAKCAGEIDFKELNGLEAIVGMDLSSKIDLTSVSFEFLIDGEYVCLSHSFMPQNTVHRKEVVDRVPYSLWIEQGWITATSGDVVDYKYIISYIQKKEKELGIHIKEICYDPWNSTQTAQELDVLGYEMVEIRQGMRTLAGPTKHFREEVYKGNVKHNNNPVLNWAMGNAVTRSDPNENIMLDKSKAIQRIDPAAALMASHVRRMLLEENNKSVYEERGIRSV